jgi:hypothetical protein
LLFKSDLTDFVATLPVHKIAELDRALTEALEIRITRPDPLLAVTLHSEAIRSIISTAPEMPS